MFRAEGFEKVSHLAVCSVESESRVFAFGIS